MDIEQLSKSQIVLLTLLVSFVTSIATGIVTVSLMDQAPPAIAQTVNRVIERTVETVTPAEPKSQSSASAAATTVITQEKTVIVKESDLISQAIERIAPSVVRVYTNNGENSVFLAMAVVLDNKGAVVSDSSSIDAPDVSLALSDGTRVRAFVTARDKESGLAFLQAASSSDPAPTWKPAVIALDRVVLGGSVVAVSGKTIARIAPGVVVAMSGNTTIDTNIADESILGGSPIINVDGNIVGVSTGVSRASSPSAFISSLVLVPSAPTAKKNN